MKKINKIILTILCIVLYTNKIYAANGSFTDIWSDSGSGSETPSDPNPDGIDGRGSTGYQEYENNGNLYKCYYKHSITVGTSLDINAYNMNGKSLIPYNINTSETFPAGTWIGINATEKKYANWNIGNFLDFEIKKTYRCHYSYGGKYKTQYCNTKSCKCLEDSTWTGIINEQTVGCKVHDNMNDTCVLPLINKTYECKQNYLTGGWSYYGDPITVNQNQNITINDCTKSNGIKADKLEIVEENIEEETSPIKECRNDAVNKIKEEAENSVGKASNKLEFNTSNKYGQSSNLQIDATNKYDKVQTKIISEQITNNYYVSSKGKAWQDYEYVPNKVCIDLITSEIKYNNECNLYNTSIRQVENGETYDEYLKENISYWKYFIPLDATTNSKLSLNMIENTDKDSQGRLKPTLTEKQCLNGMKNKPNDDDNYKFYIKPLEGNFVGDYKTGENRSEDVKRVKKDHGCLIAIVLNFNVVQKFYGQTSNYQSLKGYNMYFRQIDINNPFPNGIDSNSIWNGQYDESNKKVNTGNGSVTLSDFKNITYKANVSITNAETIRTFNQNTPYTQWTQETNKANGMKINGKSNFIQQNTGNGSIFTKTDSSFYKLGCGPANYNTWSWCKS